MSDSEFVAHEPCPSCGSDDNLARYSDGHGYCFGCDHWEPGDQGVERPSNVSVTKAYRVKSNLIDPGEARPLSKRKLSQETCQKFGYTVSSFNGQTVQVAPYYDADGRLVAQHIRFPNKDFIWLGDPTSAVLWGQHIWKDGGKRVVVTEGEVDALSISQVQGNKWPVVSIACGAAQEGKTKKVEKYIAKNLSWLERFDEVVFAFDMDPQGQASARAAAMLVSPGKAKIATYPLKDASDMLVAGRADELVSAIWQAKEFRPDGLLRVSDIIERALQPPQVGYPFPWERLTELTFGRQPGRVYAWGAGTGAGKTDVLMQVTAHAMRSSGERIALFMFENDPAEVARYVAAKLDGKLYNAPGSEGWTPEELRASLQSLADDDRLIIYDNFGTCDWDEVRNHIRYLAKSWEATSVVLDTITAFTARADDERRAVEKLMADIAMLAKELHIVIDVVSHLSTPDGKPHEEGGRVMIRHFKGSRSIGYWSHVIFGLERNQQADDPDERRTATLRVLKCRPRGSSVGQRISIQYNPETGLYQELTDNPFDDDDNNEEPF